MTILDQIIGGKLGVSIFQSYLSLRIMGSQIGFGEAELPTASGLIKVKIVSDEEYERLKKLEAFQ